MDVVGCDSAGGYSLYVAVGVDDGVICLWSIEVPAFDDDDRVAGSC